MLFISSELQQKYSQLTSYVNQVENENVSLQLAKGELQTKIGELEAQLLAEKNVTVSLESKNLEMRQKLLSMEKVVAERQLQRKQDNIRQILTQQYGSKYKLLVFCSNGYPWPSSDLMQYLPEEPFPLPTSMNLTRVNTL